MPQLKTQGQIHDTLTGYDFRVDPIPTRQKAIRLKCLECQSSHPSEVKTCQIYDCPLWNFRLGKGKTRDELGIEVQKVQTSGNPNRVAPLKAIA